MQPSPKNTFPSRNQSKHIIVKDTGNLRSLYFRDGVLQSQMNLAAPQELCLSYTKYMCLPLVLPSIERLLNILVIGVGGGSFIRFFSHYFPHVHIDAVDNMQEIFDIGRDSFALHETENIHFHCCCGKEYLEQSKQKYDLILIDAFDMKGMAENIYSHSFFDLCSDRLTEHGILSCNTWSGNRPQFMEMRQSFECFFPEHLYLPVPQRGNIIFYGFMGKCDFSQLHPKNRRVQDAEMRYAIDFTNMVSSARRANMPLWKRIL